MNAAWPGRPGEERARQVPHRNPQHDAPEQRVPQVGMEVAGYRLEATVGSGGQGTVFRARREGLPFAVKFIPLSRAPWARRELSAP